jgi:hypothetical protein
MPRTIVGGDVTEYQPGTVSPMPSSRSTSPFMPKSVQSDPVCASTAIRRASSVPHRIRVRQGASGGASGTA